MSKDQTIHLKVSMEILKSVSDLANKNERTVQAQALVLLKKGLHQEQYNPEDFK